MKTRGPNSVTDTTLLCKTVNTLYNRRTSSGFFFPPWNKKSTVSVGRRPRAGEADRRASSSGGLRSREGPAEVLPAPEAVAVCCKDAESAQERTQHSGRRAGGIPASAGRARARENLEEGRAHDLDRGQDSGELGACPSQGGSRSQSRLFLPGAGGRPQLPRPVGKRAAVCREDAAVGVMSEEPADAGFEGVRGQPPLRLRFLLLPRPLLPPVTDAHAPVQNCGWIKEKKRAQLAAGPWLPGGWGGRRRPRRHGRGREIEALNARGLQSPLKQGRRQG